MKKIVGFFHELRNKFCLHQARKVNTYLKLIVTLFCCSDLIKFIFFRSLFHIIFYYNFLFNLFSEIYNNIYSQTYSKKNIKTLK